ncbi:MAG: anaerobic ribonucleoside-triphosphate reductase activating protein [Coriobacteriia bacterium]|nr:anaerobic ribonucleoside-triphosphate reductase activating protein [Coriobacteriia bacterium]
MSDCTKGNSLNDYRVGGVSLFSTVDWPGHITATVFLKGCPWRCSYCHNKHLLSKSPSVDDLFWGQVIAELDKRRGFLDGIVFSGGEPLISAHLAELISEVKSRGFLVGLHTNGTKPSELKTLLAKKDTEGNPFVDWVGLDIKTSFSCYDELTCAKGSSDAVLESLASLQESAVEYELRTTLYPEAFDKDTLHALGEELLALGERNWILQKCREEGSNRESPLPFNLEAARQQLLQQGFETLLIR